MYINKILLQTADGFRRSWLQTCVTNLSIVPHTLGVLTATITYCAIHVFPNYINEFQVNA